MHTGVKAGRAIRSQRISWGLVSMALIAVCLMAGGPAARAAGPQGQENGQRRAWIYKQGGSNGGQMRRAPAREFTRGGGFRHRHDDDGGSDTPGLFPHWTRTLPRDGVNYEITTIGSDPRRGSKTTTIPVLLIPVRLEYPDGSASDGTDPVAGKAPIDHMLASPVFTPRPFASNGMSLGTTQWVDAYARASLGEDLGRRAPDYHVVLSPRVGPKQTIPVAVEDWWAAYDVGRGIWVNAPSIDAMDAAMTAIVRQLHVPTDTMTVFVTGDVPFVDTAQLAWALGFYDITNDQPADAAPNAMAVVDFLDAGQWNDFSPDTVVVAHELMHWLTNPYFDGDVAPYLDPGPYAEPTWCGSDSYNVIDPIQWMTVAPPSMAPYHLPEVLLPPWFTHRAGAARAARLQFLGQPDLVRRAVRQRHRHRLRLLRRPAGRAVDVAGGHQQRRRDRRLLLRRRRQSARLRSTRRTDADRRSTRRRQNLCLRDLRDSRDRRPVPFDRRGRRTASTRRTDGS